MKAQCLYTHPHLMRRVSSLIAEYEEIFHVLSLIGKRHSCLSVVFLTHSLGYDLEIGHHVFPPPRPDVLSCCVTSSWHVATKWKQLLVFISLHIFITRYISCTLIPHILPLCCSQIFIPAPPVLPKKASHDCVTVRVPVAKEVLDSVMNMQPISSRDVCLCL